MDKFYALGELFWDFAEEYLGDMMDESPEAFNKFLNYIVNGNSAE